MTAPTTIAVAFRVEAGLNMGNDTRYNVLREAAANAPLGEVRQAASAVDEYVNAVGGVLIQAAERIGAEKGYNVHAIATSDAEARGDHLNRYAQRDWWGNDLTWEIRKEIEDEAWREVETLSRSVPPAW